MVHLQELVLINLGTASGMSNEPFTGYESGCVPTRKIGMEQITCRMYSCK
jgi:hypothetical protein